MRNIRYSILLFLLLLVNYCIFTTSGAVQPLTKEIIKEFPQFSFQELCSLVVERKGDGPNSQMITKEIRGALKSNVSYKLTANGFQEMKKKGKEMFIAAEDDSLVMDKPPKYIEVIGTWNINKIAKDVEANANILGKNDMFGMQGKELELHVPVVEATKETLAYYNARLLRVGDRVKFNLSENFPITVMEVGPNYVDEYLMKAGGGFYIEYHNQPHFHMPMDKNARGFYLLGRKVGENTYRFTAFKIPFGYAVFTHNNAIHCDAGLIGNYIVGYTLAKEYSTAMVRSSDQKRVKVVASS